MPAMLNLWRRHTPKCPHRKKGRAHIKCKCPIWVDGELHGKRFRHSTGVRDWQRALRKVAAWESPGRLTFKPIEEAVKLFLQHHHSLAESTLRKYCTRLERQLLPYCRQQEIEHVHEVSVEMLDGFRSGRGLAATTATKELETLRQFFSFCVKRNWASENTAMNIDPPRNAKPAPVEPYTPSEIAKFVVACKEFGKTSYERRRAKAMLMLLRYAALRVSDIGTLRRDRIKDGEILLHTQKTGGTVYLPLPAEVLAALDAVPRPRGDAESPYFFCTRRASKRSMVSVAERSLRAVFRKSEVHNARTHRFRHTLATEILVRGGTEQDVADILGISPRIVREHYTKWTPGRQKRIATIMRRVHSGTFLAQAENEAVIN